VNNLVILKIVYGGYIHWMPVRHDETVDEIIMRLTMPQPEDVDPFCRNCKCTRIDLPDHKNTQ